MLCNKIITEVYLLVTTTEITATAITPSTAIPKNNNRLGAMLYLRFSIISQMHSVDTIQQIKNKKNDNKVFVN